MPKRMPRFDLHLLAVARTATAIVEAGELAHVSSDNTVRKKWATTRLEALYELAYLRIFAAWESCLEGIFYRSLCGYASSAGREVIVGGAYYSSVAAAEAAVLPPGFSYTLWHSPTKVIRRCQQFIQSGTGGGPDLQRTVLASNVTRLEYLSYARHRIVHDQADAKVKFNNATRSLVGRTYLASRPGKFLRDWDASGTARRRWLETLIQELTGLARQMV